MKITRQYLEDLKRRGKIRDYKIQERKPRKEDPRGRIVAKHFTKRSKEKDWIGWNLLYWTNENAVQLQEEYSFHPTRNWRFDWAIPSLRVAIEYEGVISEKSRHTTLSGFSNDAEKYNEAAALGWKLIRLTALNYKTLHAALNKYKP